MPSAATYPNETSLCTPQNVKETPIQKPGDGTKAEKVE
jgi:hypothetical protein